MLEHKRSLRYETVVHGVDGTDYDVIVAKTPLVADDGTVTGLAAVVTDISEQKRISAALEKARMSAEAAMHAKSRFLANMSHELRTPLNGVVGMASLLENTALDAKQRRFVRTLKSSAEALVTLINDVLDLSKAEAGKLELSRGPFELRRELEQVVGLFSARAHDKGIDLAAHIGRDVPAVINGDPIRLRQVLEQPRQQRGEVHRVRRGAAGGAHRSVRRLAHGAGILGHRHRPRRGARRAAAHLRGLRTG